ncbi:hypothetical protein C0J52_21352 [Blattella germanica]|nr:hypothetical protein C0J52_21352 [Blattella germanica]
MLIRMGLTMQSKDERKEDLRSMLVKYQFTLRKKKQLHRLSMIQHVPEVSLKSEYYALTEAGWLTRPESAR